MRDVLDPARVIARVAAAEKAAAEKAAAEKVLVEAEAVRQALRDGFEQTVSRGEAAPLDLGPPLRELLRSTMAAHMALAGPDAAAAQDRMARTWRAVAVLAAEEAIGGIGSSADDVVQAEAAVALARATLKEFPAAGMTAAAAELGRQCDELELRNSQTLLPALLQRELNATPAQAAELMAFGIQQVADLLLLSEEDVTGTGVPRIHARRGLASLRKVAEDAAKGRSSAELGARGDLGGLSEDLGAPSTTDMQTSAHPPSVTQEDWTAARDALWERGRAFKGKQFKGTPEQAPFRVALAMNQIQELYHVSLSTVGGQGRLLVERALVMFLGCEPDPVLRPRPTIDDRIFQYGALGSTSKAVVGALHALRMFGNRTDHDSMDDLLPREKPAIVAAAYCVAQAVLKSTTSTTSSKGLP
mmetsp:Transcript_26004/g.57567  ORF Transcript_26004/g.57567 Transcript_26004/m.57567 type:complete len:416 (+) Transcript_26004:428-1675(+)